MPKQPQNKKIQNPRCRLLGKSEWSKNEYFCKGPCEGCGHDEFVYQERIRYLHEHGLRELPNGLMGLQLPRKSDTMTMDK